MAIEVIYFEGKDPTIPLAMFVFDGPDSGPVVIPRKGEFVTVGNIHGLVVFVGHTIDENLDHTIKIVFDE